MNVVGYRSVWMRFKPRIWLVACTIACTVMAAAECTAQAPGEGVIKGLVLTARDAVPVPFATVTLDSSTVGITADSGGMFVFRAVPAGRHTIVVRRLGFAPAGANTVVKPDSESQVVVRLDPTARTLPEVEVRGRKVLDLPRFTTAVERASRNSGAVFTAADIAKLNPLDTKSLLGQVPGVHVDDRGVTFVRCQDSGTLSGSRSSRSGGPGGLGGADAARRSPRVQVYVDGTRMTRYLDAPVAADGGGFDANADFNVNGALKNINPRSIAVMEVYSGIAKIPGEFLEDACAVIVIWTKAY